MASASTSEVFNCTPEQFFAIISDYEKYHEFLAEVTKCNVLKNEGSKKLVEYNVKVVKSFTYTLWMTEDQNKSIQWKLDKGDMFKTSVGSWFIEPTKDGKTKATYSVDATFNMFVPGPIAKALVSVNLPAMMASYKQRVKKLYGV